MGLTFFFSSLLVYKSIITITFVASVRERTRVRAPRPIHMCVEDEADRGSRENIMLKKLVGPNSREETRL